MSSLSFCRLAWIHVRARSASRIAAVVAGDNPAPVHHRRKSVMLRDVSKFAESLPELERNAFQRFRSRLGRRLTTPLALYCVDKKLADAVAKVVAGDDPGRAGGVNPIVEFRPGPGILSRAILDRGVPALRMYEGNTQYADYLRHEVGDSYPAQIVDVRNDDLTLLAKKDFADHADPKESRVAELLQGLRASPLGWNGAPALTVVGTLVNRKDVSFLRYVTSQCLLRRTLFQYGRVKLYLCLTPTIFKYVTSTPDSGFNLYKGQNILLQTLFEVKEIETFPRESFFPWPSLKQLRHVPKRTTLTNEERIHFVSLEAKKGLPGVSEDEWRELAFFIMHHLTSRKRAIIPALEQWIPGCGVKLIESGLSIYSRFGDLNPDRLVELFCFFRSLPDYDSCAFKDALALSHDAIAFPFSLADVNSEKPRTVDVKTSALAPVARVCQGENADEHGHQDDDDDDDAVHHDEDVAVDPTESSRAEDT